MAFEPSQITSNSGHVELARSNTPVDAALFSGQVSLEDQAWKYVEIEEFRWNQQYPYQLVYLQKQIGGQGWSALDGATFTLPIPPEELTRSMPGAIELSVTAGGIVEQHNGSPVRPIHFSGTTGLLPLRGSGTPLAPRTLGQSIFAGTLRGVSGLTQDIRSAAQGNQSLFKANLVNSTDIASGTLRQSTGYYQFLMLERFLEQFLALKKSKGGSSIALGLAIHKEKAVYLVSFTEFTLRRSKAEPLLWNYSLGLKAFGRTIVNRGRLAGPVNQSPFRNQDLLTKVLNKLSLARRALAEARSTIEGFGQDVDHTVFEPLRQTALFLKGLAGATITCADLPANLVRDMKGAILEVAGASTALGGARGAIANLDNSLKQQLAEARDTIQSFSVVTNKSSTQNGILDGSQTVLDTSADPANTILDNPEDNFELFDAILPGQLNLPPATQAAINAERNRLTSLTRTDFANFRAGIEQFAADFADAVGAGSSTYNRTYGRDDTRRQNRTTTSDEWGVLSSLNDAVTQINKLAATTESASPTPNVMQYVAGLAGPQDIQFQIPTSKFSVPFPYGSTLEMLAARYLNNPDRWIEIAVLNNLAAPYIDEQGFTLPLVTAGNGNQVELGGASNLYVGQTLYIESNNSPRTVRTIQSIQPVGTNWVITVDGDADLARFEPTALAFVTAFLPNTVNSQKLVFIPSDKPAPDEDFLGPPNEAFAGLEQQLALGGADLLLTADGDLAITDDGDCRLAVGLANLVQRVRLAVDTPRGSLVRHPSYGFPTIVGQSTADLTAEQILSSSKTLLSDDPSFSGVKSIAVSKQGPVVLLNMTVAVAGTSQLLPITVQVPIS